MTTMRPTLLAVAMATLCAVGAPLVVYAQAPAAASAADQAPALRPEIAPSLQAAQKALQDKNFEPALEQLKLAEQVPGRTPFETYLIERMRFLALAGLRDTAGALKALEAALATGQVEADLKATLMDQASNAAYALKDYDKTIAWARRALDAGAPDEVTRMRLAHALYLQGQHAESVQVLSDLDTRQRASGQKASETQLRLKASNLAKMGDEAGYAGVLEDLLALAPKPELWADRLSRLRRQVGFDLGLKIDIFRLSRRVGAFATAEADEEYADLALRAGFPSEAKAVLDAGFAAGRLGQGADAAEHRALRDRVAKAAAADSGSAAPDAASLLARDPAVAQAAGWAQFTAGQRAAGLDLMRQAVQRAMQSPSAQTSVPRLRLRLAEALALAGDSVQARAEWAAARDAATIDGVSDLARLGLLSLGGS